MQVREIISRFSTWQPTIIDMPDRFGKRGFVNIRWRKIWGYWGICLIEPLRYMQSCLVQITEPRWNNNYYTVTDFESTCLWNVTNVNIAPRWGMFNVQFCGLFISFQLCWIRHVYGGGAVRLNRFPVPLLVATLIVLVTLTLVCFTVFRTFDYPSLIDRRFRFDW